MVRNTKNAWGDYIHKKGLINNVDQTDFKNLALKENRAEKGKAKKERGKIPEGRHWSHQAG